MSWLLRRVLRPPFVSAPMSTVASKITQLSATFPPVFTNCIPNLDPFISSRKNVLSIDLVENENPDNPIQTSDKVQRYPKRVLREDLTNDSVRLEREMLKASQGPEHIRERDWPLSTEQLDRNTLLIHRLRKIVSEDAARQPEDRIDCVEIGPEPWPEHLRALDGLSPKHLRVNAGFDEEIDVFELDKLNTKFKLKSLCISGVVDDWSIPPHTSDTSVDLPFPEFFTHVTSLTLHYCHWMSFGGTNLPTHLRQLKIIASDAMDMFILAMDKMPNASEQLEKVLIYTDPEVDMYRFRLNDFRERLRRSKGLKELTFIVADSYEARVAKCADIAVRYPTWGPQTGRQFSSLRTPPLSKRTKFLPSIWSATRIV